MNQTGQATSSQTSTVAHMTCVAQPPGKKSSIYPLVVTNGLPWKENHHAINR